MKDNESDTCQSEDNMKTTLIKVKATIESMKMTLLKMKVHKSDSLKNSPKQKYKCSQKWKIVNESVH